jgi:hypothetical protein
LLLCPYHISKLPHQKFLLPTTFLHFLVIQ